MDELIEIRVEKKGLFGFTGAPDWFGGVWEPATVEMIADGCKVSASFPETLKFSRRHPAWRVALKHLSPEEAVAEGLRIQPTRRTGGFGSSICFITTMFKRAGISGWQNGPLASDSQLSAAITGRLVHQPSPGTDGFVSLDLLVNRVDFRDREFEPSNAQAPRYVRAEYLHGKDHRFKKWHIGDTFRIEGPLKWDTDRNGFFEIHPTTATQVQTIASSENH
jgi:hypothetical protein